jgi:hypothetical protein
MRQPDMPYDKERLARIVQQVRLLNEEAGHHLIGRRVALKRKLNGLKRTGAICWVSVATRRIGVGVEVDRLDGKPGVLPDTYYCSLDGVEVEE